MTGNFPDSSVIDRIEERLNNPGNEPCERCVRFDCVCYVADPMDVYKRSVEK